MPNRGVSRSGFEIPQFEDPCRSILFRDNNHGVSHGVCKRERRYIRDNLVLNSSFIFCLILTVIRFKGQGRHRNRFPPATTRQVECLVHAKCIFPADLRTKTMSGGILLHSFRFTLATETIVGTVIRRETQKCAKAKILFQITIKIRITYDVNSRYSPTTVYYS